MNLQQQMPTARRGLTALPLPGTNHAPNTHLGVFSL